MITVANLVAYKMLLGANLGIQASISQCCKPPIMPPCPGTTSFLYANKLAKYQRFIDVIVGDGNCFFRAISKELFGSEKFHNDLRQILTKFTMHNPTLFQALDFTSNFKKYCNRMSRKSTYATQVELQATATFLQLPMYVYTKPSPTKDWQWTCFVPQKITTLSYAYEIALKNLPLPAPPHYHIEICHTNLNHYDRVIPLNLISLAIQLFAYHHLTFLKAFWEAAID